jgi:nucleotide-binding universal stress UspA family protein
MSLENQGIDVDAEIREAHVGQIARSILQAAEEHDAHIIVLGSVRNTDLPHIPIGSVTHNYFTSRGGLSWSYLGARAARPPW